MRSVWRTLGGGTVRDIALVCGADAVVGVSFGAIAVAGGLPPWVPIAMSLAVFAGGAQFAAVAVVLAGGGSIAAVVAGLLLNTRLLPYGFAVADVLGGGVLSRMVGAQLITDEPVGFTMRREDAPGRRAAFWTCGITLFVSWNLAVLGGVFAGQAIGNPDALGLDAAFPVVLLALVLPSLADRGTRNAALVGGGVALAASPFLPAGLPVLAALSGLAVFRQRGDRQRDDRPRSRLRRRRAPDSS